MNRRFTTVLAAALLIAGAATLLFYKLISGRLQSAPRPVTTRLIVASRNLEIGTLIKEPDLTTVEWPGTVPNGAAVKTEDVVGRGVVSAIFKDEPILQGRLAPKGAGAGLAATIPPGMRAVAVRVNEIIGVAGFVVPGMRVDVLIAGTPPGQGGNAQGTLSRTLLQNIEVLSAGQNIQKDTEGKPITVPVVNLLVTPEQAETLTLASKETNIQLVLRNPLDTQPAKTPGTAVRNLFAGTKGIDLPSAASEQPRPRRPRVVAVVAPKPKPAPVVVEVLQGSSKTQTKFESPED